jgi:hypothetical protein
MFDGLPQILTLFLLAAVKEAAQHAMEPTAREPRAPRLIADVGRHNFDAPSQPDPTRRC